MPYKLECKIRLQTLSNNASTINFQFPFCRGKVALNRDLSDSRSASLGEICVIWKRFCRHMLCTPMDFFDAFTI